MLPATRLGDKCTGHELWPPRSVIQGSHNVFINDLPAVRLFDKWAYHCIFYIIPICHDGYSSGGAMNIFVNDLPKVRMGDEISCESKVAQGSYNVFSGM